MCEPTVILPNATDVEVECRWCADYYDCKSHNCVWKSLAVITREDLLSGVPLGDCLENRDPAAIMLSVGLMTAGWCVLIWCMGWCIKDTGKLAVLRRYGVTVSADVVDQHLTYDEMTSMEGYPILMTSYFAVVEFVVESPRERQKILGGCRLVVC